MRLNVPSLFGLFRQLKLTCFGCVKTSSYFVHYAVRVVFGSLLEDLEQILTVLPLGLVLLVGSGKIIVVLDVVAVCDLLQLADPKVLRLRGLEENREDAIRLGRGLLNRFNSHISSCASRV